MGIFDIFKDDDEEKPDFSNVEAGSSSTAPRSQPPPPPPNIAPPKHEEEVEFFEEEPEIVQKTYAVRKGDTLWDIAEEQLGAGKRWKELEKANEDIIDDPDRIYPGMELVIPGTKYETEESQQTDHGGLV